MFHKGKHNREKQLRFSIRKVSFGAASVAVAALFMFLGNGAVSAAEQGVPSTNGETQAPQPKDQNIQNGTYEGNTVAISPAATVETNTQPSTVENSSSPESAPQKVETLDKKELTDLIKEIDGKLSQGTYASKTDNSVNQLKTALDEAKSVLNKAKTQAELSQAHANLVVATTKLQTKPEEKKEVAAVDTTNGKATVGKKATNTEKSSESNSIANSGSKDERNGKALDANNPFRTDTTPSTTDDTSANQVFDNPAEGADVKTLSNKLESLPETIQNNEKIQNMDELGKAKNVDKGKVVEIYEFGGWNAVAADGKPGKFAIARKTDKGVFPIETVNTVWDSKGKTYQTWVLEQSFDRTSDYMLFLSKVRTQADSKEETFDGSNYVHTGEGRQIAKGVKGFNGIQKTFKAYSKEHGSKVVVSFKTGYTGDIEGTKAQYKVEVIINRNGKEEKLYDQTFKPQEAQQNDEMTVVKASDGKNSPKFITTPDNPSPTKEDLEAKIANNKPNGTGGTFTSKEIEIPKGVTEYTVRISSADNQHLGMGYQSVHRHYALPLTGSNFSIKQDTKNVAKDLLQRIYNRLVEQKSEDTKWSTPETKGAYETKLTEINALLNSGINTTSNYKESAKLLIEKYKSLNNRDTIVEAAKADLVEAAKAEKAEIAADKSLTEAERKEKEQAVDTKKVEEEAKITAAENADKVAEAKTAGVTAIKGVHTPGNLDTVKEAAKADLAEAAKAEKAEIAADKNLTEAERKEKETAVDTKKAEEEAKITAAENADKVAEAKTAGETAVKAVHDNGDLEANKEKALEAIQTASESKIASIDKNAKLSDDEKAAAKAEVAKAAIAAVNAINEAKDQDGVDGAQTTGVKAIEAVTPVGKEKALEAIQTASEAKIASIDKNAKLSDDEKAAAKAEVAKAAIAAVNAINEAKDQDGVDGAQTAGVKAIEAVTPVGKEKALEAIQTASETKIASIDKNAKLSDDEKAVAKAEVAKAALAAVNAINEAKDQDGVDGAQTTGVKAIEAVTPVGTSSTVGEGNVITPPTVEVPEYTDPVGTSSTDGAGNLITPPTVEVPAYTEPVGTSSTDGAGNLITPPTAEVPAYTDPVGTSSTDGEGNLITPPTVEIPAYTDPVGTSSTDGEGNVVTPPTVEIPAYTEPVGTSSTSGDGNVVTPPTAEVPAYTGSVNGISEEMPAQPHKDGSANEMSDGTPVFETTINKDRQLPNTGTADSTVAMVAAAASAVLGLGLAGRRRKEDEEA